MADLVPAPFAALLRRLVREHDGEGKVFDLPASLFWRGDPDLDTSVLVHGRRAGNPVGPAAGPHGQMAQNIALSWLAGGRFLELKTVQRNDRLTIPRPCIDMATVGYNVEWSQELSLRESLREYVAGSMLIDVLRERNVLGDPGQGTRDATLLDMSVGYDLAGVRSPEIRAWIASMKDARAEVDALRSAIPDDLRRYRDLDYRTALSDQVTLSTFHGCPAGEVEAIARFLLEELDLHVTVKLNPTLLGRATVEGLLHDALGYTEIGTRPEDFANDLSWEEALVMTDRLTERARALGRTFRVKLTNTLVVKNHRSFFPPGERVMYLSGAPLHVLTLHLVERFRQARPELPISFSAGVDSRNFADCVALDLAPVTTCTDLLKPGGFGRLPRYLDRLQGRMRALGAPHLGDFVIRAEGQGESAIRAVLDPSPLRDAVLHALRDGGDLRSVLAGGGPASLYDRIVRTAGRLNVPAVVKRATADPRYRAESNRRPPRKVGRHLALFDCLSCDKCLPACPNDANFVYEVPPQARDTADYRIERGRPVPVAGRRFEVRDRHQIATFPDFCNDCGNCDVFCPEDGGPHREKPRFFASREAWQLRSHRDGFFVERRGERDEAWGRVSGREYHLEVDRATDCSRFGDGVLTRTLRHRERRVVGAAAEPGAPDGHTLDFSAFLAMATVVDGVLDPARANPVNTRRPAGC